MDQKKGSIPVEPFLIRSGLVIKDGSTRQLSAYGHEYILHPTRKLAV
jgi:hypothetical protein